MSIKKILEVNVVKYNTLQIGQSENPNVIRGPTHFFSRTFLQQCRWNTWQHVSYIKKKRTYQNHFEEFSFFQVGGEGWWRGFCSFIVQNEWTNGVQ